MDSKLEIFNNINARQQTIDRLQRRDQNTIEPAVPAMKCGYCSHWNEYPASRGKSDGPRGKCTELQKETAFYDFCSKGKSV